MHDDRAVLIAGAGPVGLVAANLLADAGIPVVVFEAEPALPQTLRASTFQPPTLDMLARFGVTERLMQMGRKAPKLQYRDRFGWAAEFDFGLIADRTAHPFRLQCEQFKLNRLLAERLARFPHARLEFCATVCAVSQDAAGVVVDLEGPAGPRRVRGSWLIGADGGRSRVRASLGVKMEGFTWEERYVVISTPFDFAAAMPGLCGVSYTADPEHWHLLLQLPDLWRALFAVRPEESEASILSEAAVQNRLAQACPRHEPFPVSHCTIYAVHQRIAARYRAGRVFLAGDAAHLNNPLGGMGMNGGIHDAFNLAEKLVTVVRGDRPEGDLDRYEEQRRPVAVEYVDRISIANKRNLETGDAVEQSRWRESLSRAAADPELARDYLTRVSMIASLEKATVSL